MPPPLSKLPPIIVPRKTSFNEYTALQVPASPQVWFLPTCLGALALLRDLYVDFLRNRRGGTTIHTASCVVVLRISQVFPPQSRQAQQEQAKHLAEREHYKWVNDDKAATVNACRVLGNDKSDPENRPRDGDPSDLVRVATAQTRGDVCILPDHRSNSAHSRLPHASLIFPDTGRSTAPEHFEG